MNLFSPLSRAKGHKRNKDPSRNSLGHSTVTQFKFKHADTDRLNSGRTYIRVNYNITFSRTLRGNAEPRTFSYCHTYNRIYVKNKNI